MSFALDEGTFLLEDEDLRLFPERSPICSEQLGCSFSLPVPMN
jgi:hypothetical protein